MFKKSKIRKDFNDAYAAGNEAMIEQLLNEHPWLIAEWEAKQGGDSAAAGVGDGGQTG